MIINTEKAMKYWPVLAVLGAILSGSVLAAWTWQTNQDDKAISQQMEIVEQQTLNKEQAKFMQQQHQINQIFMQRLVPTPTGYNPYIGTPLKDLFGPEKEPTE